MQDIKFLDYPHLVVWKQHKVSLTWSVSILKWIHLDETENS